MTDPQQALSARVSAAIVATFGDDYIDTDPVLRASQNPRFGDFQANAAMALGKRLGRSPRQVAESIVAKLDLTGLCDRPPEIAGPGFINLRLSNDCLASLASSLTADERLGVPRAVKPQTIVVDYSGPNVAKEMHVGHIRSTVIGDALARTLKFLGHTVIRQNHLGDWGTQFGMLIEHLNDEKGAEPHFSISDLNAFYQEAKKRFDTEPGFAERARKRVVALQRGDEQTLARWRTLVEESKRHFNDVYARLRITLEDSDVRGESFYNDQLPEVVDALLAADIAVDTEGAVGVFVPGFVGKDGEPVPLIIRKNDGGFGYAATDLAALRYRTQCLGADRLVYVVDARQSGHFEQLFWVARRVGWLDEQRTAEHVKFGTILGEDGKPFKTRSGDTVKLAELLDEAGERAMAIVRDRSPDLPDADAKRIAGVVGIGAIKYGDLSADRIKDYVFSWSRMLAMDGNTAPYLQYAYARIRSIFRKVDEGGDGVAGAKALRAAVSVTHDAERALILELTQFSPVVRSLADRLEPHHLCNYLYELATTFSSFYESCPVLRAETEEQKQSRLALCDLTARALKQGLELLGIETLERM